MAVVRYLKNSKNLECLEIVALKKMKKLMNKGEAVVVAVAVAADEEHITQQLRWVE